MIGGGIDDDRDHPTLSEEKKATLLHKARLSRLQWILQAREKPSLQQPIAGLDEKKTVVIASSSSGASGKDVGKPMPGLETMQEILHFLNDLASGEAFSTSTDGVTDREGDAAITGNFTNDPDIEGDNFALDMESILMSAPINADTPEDLDNLVKEFQLRAESSQLSSYEFFLQQLLLPQAAPIVKSLQQFVVKFQVAMRRANVHRQEMAFSGSASNSSSSSPTRNGKPAASSAPIVDSRTGKAPSLPLTPEEEIRRHAASIWDFLDHVFDQMRECPLWKAQADAEAAAATTAASTTSTTNSSSSSGSSSSSSAPSTTLEPNSFEISKQACEKFVFIKLYPFIFANGIDNEEMLMNRQIQERIAMLSFITAEHLDIKSLQQLSAHLAANSAANSNTIPLKSAKSTPVKDKSSNTDPIRAILHKPIQELSRLQYYRSPTDKLQCLKRCSIEIATILKQARALINDKSLPGADELLPMMILVIKYCNPLKLHSELNFLQRYTRPKLLTSEAGYLITHFVSAVYFLDSVDAQALTIEPDAFEKAMQEAKVKAKQQIAATAKAAKQEPLGLEGLLARGRAERGENGAAILPPPYGFVFVDCDRLRSEYKAKMKEIEEQEPISVREYVKMRIRKGLN